MGASGEVLVGVAPVANQAPQPPGGIPVPPPVVIAIHPLPVVGNAVWKKKIIEGMIACILLTIFFAPMGYLEWILIDGFLHGDEEKKRNWSLFFFILIAATLVCPHFLFFLYKNVKACTPVTMCGTALCLIVVSGVGVGIYGFVYYLGKGDLSTAIPCLFPAIFLFLILIVWCLSKILSWM